MATETTGPAAGADRRRFEGRVALVVGASRGIGAATARAFAREGAQVVLASRDVPALERLAREIRDAGGRALVQRLDLAEPASVEALGEAVRAGAGGLDCAFNNAGEGARPAPLADIPPETFERVQRVTVEGTFRALRQEIRLLTARGGGAIVNMSSTAGQSAFAGGAPYVAAKHAILGLTKAAALDYARAGIRVNAVAPGPIDTEPIRAAPEPYREQARAAVPMRRLGAPEEVADVVLWLSSSESAFVTGATVFVDGGRMAGFA
jgi:NAD(P)-dependent dehydrogenase (short-subunit alcohol dehydrogenase family)